MFVGHYATLTPHQRRLADFIMQNSAEAAMMSSRDMARHLRVSEATVVRFAQQIGYEGYPEFRQALQGQVLREIRSSERVAAVLEDSDQKQGILHQVVASTTRHLELLLRNVSEESLSQVVDVITKAHTVYIFGEGAPAGVTIQLGFWLNRLGCNVNVVNQTGRRFFDAIFRAGKNDIALVFAFRKVGAEATALIEYLHEKGGESILFTDVPSSLVHSLASHVLLVQRGPMETYRPLGAVTAIVDAIVMGVMLARGDDAVHQLRNLDDLRQRYGLL
jgi:DNA-binding MurR/RpiR family transcriptional regulator